MSPQGSLLPMSTMVLLVTINPLWSLTTLSCVLGISSQTENQLWPSTGISVKPPSEQIVRIPASSEKAFNHSRRVPWWRSSSRSLTLTISKHLKATISLYSTTSLWDKYYWVHFPDEETEGHGGEPVVCPKLWGSERQELRQNHKV